MTPETPHEISVVVPVYRGATTLAALVAELLALAEPQTSPGGTSWRVAEIVLVHDHGPDASDAVIRELAAAHDAVRPVWLSRNFGQHAATLAGMASAGSEWIATLDEDGQHDPAALGILLDAALAEQASVVYADPSNAAPHGAGRNLSSRLAKRIVALVSGNRDVLRYHSYRLVVGEVGRSVAAYAGAGAYLDVALGWVAARSTTAPVAMREEGGRPSGYSLRRLLSHFWRLTLSSGTRALRLVSVLGVLLALGGIGLAIYFVVLRLTSGGTPEGWTSLMTVVLVTTGFLLFAIGVVAEYLGVAVNMAMGRPAYLIGSDAAAGPLGRAPRRTNPDATG